MRLPADRFVSRADYIAWEVQHATVLADRDLVEAGPPNTGSCASCQRPTRFLAGKCDCRDRLDPPSRALLHAAVAEAGLCGWTRLRLTARRGAVAERLAGIAGSLAKSPCDVVIVDDLSHSGAKLSVEGLVAGGCLLALLPSFDPGSPQCWRLLEQARAAGFCTAEILRPWSRELCYLGDLYLLKAVR